MQAGFVIEGGLVLALVRGSADAALLSSFGALLALAWLARDAPAAAGRLRWLAGLSLAAGAGLTGLWLLLQSAALAGSAAEAGVVLRQTVFGHLVLARVVLLGLAGLALARRHPWSAAALAGSALATQAGHGHAWAMWEGPSWLLLSSTVHLLAAGAWLGGLLPLLLLVAAAPPGQAALLSARFSPLGVACVLLLAGTAGFQAVILVGTLPGLVGTGYGVAAVAKLVGFLTLLGFAARNRVRLTPALAGRAPLTAKRRLMRSIAAETAVGLLVVLAAAMLTSLPPAMHEQPLWPFPWRPSLDAVREDGALMLEAALAAAVLLASVAAMAVALLRRWRARWLIAAAGTVAAGFALPHLDLLLADAVPTQYWRSPTGFSSAAIAEGAALYPTHCASCHGAAGHGGGPAMSLPVPPADLTAGHLWAHADGELFWWLTQGMPAPGGGLAMPGFAAVLTEDQRWALIDWVRANNAGAAWAETGVWPVPIQAPGLEAACPGGQSVQLDALRGRVVRIVFGPARPVPGIVTVQATTDAQPVPGEGICATGSDAVLRAYAAVTGATPAGMAGMQILVDEGGWLRAVQRPGAVPGWDDPKALAAAVRDMQAHPVVAAPPSHAGMQM